MRRLSLILAGLALACTPPEDTTAADTDPAADPSAAPIEDYDVLDWVDPFTATGGVGVETASVHPGAAWPNGMVTVGPDTRGEGGSIPFYHFAGYYYEDDRITGFSHIHPHGMGVSEGSALTVMPTSGWDPAYTTEEGRMHAFDKADESASPGRYTVTMADPDGGPEVAVDVAASAHGAVWTVRTDDPVLVVDNGFHLFNNHVQDGSIDIDLDEGVVHVYQNLHGGYSGRFGGYNGHMVLSFDPAPVAGGTWDNPGAPAEGTLSATGATSGGWVSFAEGVTEVTVRSAVSFVDFEGAEGNLEAELSGDFDSTLAAVQTAWRDRLSTVRVSGEDPDARERFHTAMYHNHLMPSRLDDADGRYRGHDQTIHTTDRPYYSDLSLWDTFRTSHPWYIVAAPDLQLDVIASLLRMKQDGGSLARWPLAHGYTGGMVGAPAVQLMAETALKGLTDFDQETAFEAAYAALTGPQDDAGRGGLDAYTDRGWLSPDELGAPASKTLEYAWNDHAGALWAEALGKTAEAEVLWAQADNWANVWNPNQQLFTNRLADGAHVDVPSETAWVDDHYTEGCAYSYLWYVPYDVDAMIDVQHGGDVDAFHARLQGWWDEVYDEEDTNLPERFYWHGNQPPWHHVALGSLSGAPDMSAEAARYLLRTRYRNGVRGLEGNDDGGAMSAWYLWTALGFYPVAGTDLYGVTSPIFSRVEIDRPEGTFVVRAKNTSETALYVGGLSLGGQAHSSGTVRHAELFAGDEAVFEMTETPGTWLP